MYIYTSVHEFIPIHIYIEREREREREREIDMYTYIYIHVYVYAAAVHACKHDTLAHTHTCVHTCPHLDFEQFSSTPPLLQISLTLCMFWFFEDFQFS